MALPGNAEQAMLLIDRFRASPANGSGRMRLLARR